MKVLPPLNIGHASALATRLTVTGVLLQAIQGSIIDGSPGPRRFDLQKPEVDWFAIDDELRVLVNFVLRICRGEGEDVHLLAQMNILYRLDYTVLPGERPSDDQFAHFAGITGFMHVWPYLRSEVQSLTVKMGLPALTLGVATSGYAVENVTVRHIEDERGAPSMPAVPVASAMAAAKPAPKPRKRHGKKSAPGRV